MKLILVGVDRSDTARQAAERAAELASSTDATLHVMTCSKKADDDNRAFLDGLAQALPHDRVTTVAAVGDPATVICEEAARLGAGMIVVGSKRTQGATRVLGSIASDVIKQSPCDVLVAHTGS
ncbi:MAG: universal stress protein [Ilumatobacter sp.]|nr:universal stress protein [Ilumatobacter sp.]